MNRRQFLIGSTAALSAASTAFGAASSIVRVACIGGRAGHVEGFAALPHVRVAAIWDDDDPRLQSAMSRLETMGQTRPVIYSEIRALLDNPDIDVVSIAQPAGRRTPVAIAACQAGKHVYLEGSCAHTVAEAAHLAQVARRHDRIIWTGLGARSSAAARKAVQLVRDRHLGRVPLARALSYSWGDARDGDGIERAVHHMDIARQGLSVTYPSTVAAASAGFSESPISSLSCRFEFNPGAESKAIELEIRRWTSPGGGIADASAALFYGSDGFMAVNGSASYRTWIGPRHIPGVEGRATGGPHGQFIDAVRSHTAIDAEAALEGGAVSTLLVHLAVVSHRLGRPLAFDGVARTIARDPQANALLAQLQA